MSGEPGYLDALIALSSESDSHVSSGATWLLKSALEQCATLSADQTAALCEALPELSGWQAQLHICQSLRLLSIGPTGAGEVAHWLEPLLAHDRPFLRAWALDALGSLAGDHPQYRARFAKALSDAAQDDAASVRARARNLAKT